jgi:hypothetical protein
MTSRFKKGAVLSMVTVGGTAFGLLATWNAFNSTKIYDIGSQAASVVQSQIDVKESLDKREEKIDEELSGFNDDITELKINAATTKELLKLMAPRFEIDGDAVEKRVIKAVIPTPE